MQPKATTGLLAAIVVLLVAVIVTKTPAQQAGAQPFLQIAPHITGFQIVEKRWDIGNGVQVDTNQYIAMRQWSDGPVEYAVVTLAQAGCTGFIPCISEWVEPVPGP